MASSPSPGRPRRWRSTSSASSRPGAGWSRKPGLPRTDLRGAIAARARQELAQYRRAVEQAVASPGMKFRMPLQAERVARAAPADRLDDAVGHRVRFHRQAAAEVLDRLVVDRRHCRALLHRVESPETRALHELDLVRMAVVRQ